MSEEVQYGLVCPFFDGSESFTLGFECGSIWNQLKSGTQQTFTCHRKNVAQLKLFAKHFGYEMQIDAAMLDGDDELRSSINAEWCTVEFSPSASKKPKLRVVK